MSAAEAASVQTKVVLHVSSESERALFPSETPERGSEGDGRRTRSSQNRIQLSQGTKKRRTAAKEL